MAYFLFEIKPLVVNEGGELHDLIQFYVLASPPQDKISYVESHRPSIIRKNIDSSIGMKEFCERGWGIALTEYFGVVFSSFFASTFISDSKAIQIDNSFWNGRLCINFPIGVPSLTPYVFPRKYFTEFVTTIRQICYYGGLPEIEIRKPQESNHFYV